MDTTLGALITAGELAVEVAISPAEREIVRSIVANAECQLGEGDEIRGTVLGWILTLDRVSSHTAEPPLRLSGGLVTGEVRLPATTVSRSVRFSRTTFTGDTFLRQSTLRSLRFSACRLRTLDMNGCTVAGDVALEFDGPDGTEVEHVNMFDLDISGNVVIHGTRFTGDVEDDSGGLVLEDARLHGSLSIERGTDIPGGVRAGRCRIERDVHLVGLRAGSDASDSRAAVDLTRAVVGGSLFLHPRLDADDWTSVRGAVSLNHAHVAGDLACPKLRVRSSIVPGMQARSASIGGSAWLVGASISGGVDFGYASIGHNLEVNDLHVHPPEIDRSGDETEQKWDLDAPAVSLAHAQIGRRLIWDVHLPAGSGVSLAAASVGEFEYSSRIGWAERADLSGFRFEMIESMYRPLRRPRLAAVAKKLVGWKPNEQPGGTTSRALHRVAFAPDTSHLSWLRSHTEGEIDLAAYRRLAAVHAANGRQHDAELVAMAATNDRNRSLGVSRVILGIPYRIFTGNGYRPARAVWWALALIVLGAIVYDAQFDWVNFVSDHQGWNERPIQPLVFSADTLLPIVDFGETDRYQLSDAAPAWLQWFRWGQIALGWVIATTLGAAAARLTRQPPT